MLFESLPLRQREGAESQIEIAAVETIGPIHGSAKPARFSRGLDTQDLFWVLKNGVKMTGMPSFGTGDQPVSDQKIWDVVAFLK